VRLKSKYPMVRRSPSGNGGMPSRQVAAEGSGSRIQLIILGADKPGAHRQGASQISYGLSGICTKLI